tara:strand:- start:51 stop:560 length:510 start_codon:yes stop_codon:yes gene_type:complete
MIKILVLLIVLLYLYWFSKEGLKNCDTVHPPYIPKPVYPIFPYSKERCHKRDFDDVPFCKRNAMIRKNKTLKKIEDDLENKLKNINRPIYNNYYKQLFNHNYSDNLSALEASIEKYNNAYLKYINLIKTYNAQNEINVGLYDDLDELNKDVQQNKLDNTVNVRKYNVLS